VLWRCWLGGRKGIRPVKNWMVGCWRGYLGWGADLHMAQQMPLPLTISCSSKFRLVLPSWFLPFWYLLTQAVPDKFQKSSKTIVVVVVSSRGVSQYHAGWESAVQWACRLTQVVTEACCSPGLTPVVSAAHLRSRPTTCPGGCHAHPEPINMTITTTFTHWVDVKL